MKHSKSVIRMMGITGALSRRSEELNSYDIQSLFRKGKDIDYFQEKENIFPEGMNVEELKRIRSLNASLDDMGYDSLLEKFLKNIVSRRTFNFFKNE